MNFVITDLIRQRAPKLRYSERMRRKPSTEAEFKALAYAMADTGSFRDARQILNALSVWPVETGHWWDEDLAEKLNARFR